MGGEETNGRRVKFGRKENQDGGGVYERGREVGTNETETKERKEKRREEGERES